MIEPSVLSIVMVALRKNMDLRMGTLKETTARRPVAMSVTRKPGVAGRIRPITDEEEERNEGEGRRDKEKDSSVCCADRVGDVGERAGRC